ncbi:hypothetical protein AGDE_08118 [Angomonas deanei]|nr:hypothetical protein AGDE_08118 [Angomonas deanei]|eukprot:EPY33974.1 hypothetical protein AGDE_08118 [Angomonas deanei]
MEFSSGEEKDVFISDLLREDIYKYINISEVTTPSGVRWIDVKAKPEFLKEKVLSSLSEGHFASTVMRAVGRGGIPESLGAEVISESPLPFTFVDKNYICLLLRTPKNLTTEPKALNANLEQYANVLYKQLHEKKGDKTDWLNEYKRLSGVEDSNGTADGEAEGRPEDYYYDEETNTFCLKRPLQEKGFLSALKRGASFASRRRPKVAPKPMTTPSLSDMTDRLTVFIIKELIRDEDATRPPTDEEKKKYLNEPLFDYSMADKFDEMSFATAEEVKSEATPQETATNKFHSKDGACVINGEKFTVRTKIITVHRRPMPYIEFMTAQWSRMVSGVEEGADDSDDNSNISALAKEMINTWEDILLLVFVGTVQEFQRKGLTGSHMLEYLESAIFEAENNPQRFKELTTQLTQLRLLSRRSSVYEHILKETQVAYIKMKRIAKTNLSLKDKRTLAQLDSVVNLFTHTQEHSETLLYLQLQVAMNEMELHLRTLTVFSTIFIPLDFIVSFLGMNFEHGIMSVVSPNAGYALLIGLLGFVATVTTLWIRRKLSFL